MAMLALEERVEDVEEKVDRLEVLLGHFISQTGQTIRRLDRTIERLDRNLIEMKAQAIEMKVQAEEDRRLAREQFAEAKEERRLADKKFAEMQAKSEENRRKSDERFAEMQAKSEENRRYWNRKWGELSHKLGTLAEDLVAPNIPRIAKEQFGWTEVDDLMVRRYVRHRTDQSKRREFDVIAVGSNQVIINETKMTPKIQYIDSFRQALDEITDYFPGYAGFKIIPIFATLYLRDDLVAYLTKQGIYAMAMADDTMELLNFDALS